MNNMDYAIWEILENVYKSSYSSVPVHSSDDILEQFQRIYRAANVCLSYF